LVPFRFDIPESELADLYGRLDHARWPDELPRVGWAYGVPRDHLTELVRYWRHDYDWRAVEAELNQWPQFITTIDGARIHFVHIRSPEPDATPPHHGSRLVRVNHRVHSGRRARSHAAATGHRRPPQLPVGRLDDAIDVDHLLTNVMLYWLTRTAGSSARLYFAMASRSLALSMPLGSGCPECSCSSEAAVSSRIRLLRGGELDRDGYL
jgi:Epoxide hydrolase N terminus